MQVFRGKEQIRSRIPRGFAALGNFDGVHLGHRAIIETAVARARAAGGTSVVVTFDPHPRYVLKGLDPRLLCTFEERLALIEQLGVDAVLVFRFTRDFSNLSAEQFIRDYLLETIDLQGLFVGFNYHFGKGKQGDPKALVEFGKRFGFEVGVVDAVKYKGEPISSTRIRNAIAEGAVDEAAAMLGRPYAISGTVVRGDGLGRSLGFPTANISAKGRLLPARGVYAGWVQGANNSRLPAAVNLGVRPTVAHNQTGTVLEAHILDFQGDLYGKRLSVEFVKRLRAEQRFSSVEELKEQIRADVEAVRNVLGA